MHSLIERVTQARWHAVEDDLVVGRGEASRRPDGRLFLSIDTWQDAVFDQLAAAMLTVLPKPLYTVVDEADLDLTTNWTRAGFTTRRREWEYLVPTDPALTGLGAVRPPAGVAIGAAEEEPLRVLDRVIRDEVEVTVGWREMPAEVFPPSAMDPAHHTVAVRGDEYVGLVRVTGRPRLARIGLLAVRTDHRRRGVGKALLANALGALHGRGIHTATADVNESNAAATALFDGIGARRASSNLELLLG